MAAREGRGENDGVRVDQEPQKLLRPRLTPAPPLNSSRRYSRNARSRRMSTPSTRSASGGALAGASHHVAFDDRADGAELREPANCASRCSSMPPAGANDLERRGPDIVSSAVSNPRTELGFARRIARTTATPSAMPPTAAAVLIRSVVRRRRMNWLNSRTGRAWPPRLVSIDSIRPSRMCTMRRRPPPVPERASPAAW